MSCTIYWVVVETGEPDEHLKKYYLNRDVWQELPKTPGAYHWVRGIIKVSLSTHVNIRMALVRAKREVLDVTPQQRTNLDADAKKYLSTLNIEQAQQLGFPVHVIKQIWPDATGLSFTIFMLTNLLLHTDLFLW